MKKGILHLEIKREDKNKDLEVNFKGGTKDLAVAFCQICFESKEFETALLAAADTIKNIENRE
jgi:hypothetical protein